MNYLKNMISKSKNDTLCPLSIILKLFICAYKPIGTKISIYNNKIYIQEVGIFQNIERTIYSDSKNDINILFFPVIFACKFYLSVDNKERFTKIFKVVLDSFDKLKETYQGNEIIYNIEQLKNIIDSFIINDDFDPVILFGAYESPGGKIKQGIYSHINSVWTEPRLEIIFGYIDEILNTSSIELITNLIASLSSYLQCIDMITHNLITNM